MHVIADRVKESSASVGPGDFVLAGAVQGFVPFASECAVGDELYYVIEAQSPTGVPTGEWEVGRALYSAPNTLTREQIFASSNSGLLVDFAPGAKQVWVDAPAAQLAGFLDASDAFTQGDADALYAPMAHAQPWSTITATPTTLGGYGITDGLTKATADALYSPVVHSQAWSTITATPTTIAGYGIVDAFTQAAADTRYAQLSGATFAGAVTFNATIGVPALRGYLQSWSNVVEAFNFLPWGDISGTPTTLAGYGITDGLTRASADSLYAPVAHSHPWGSITGTPTTVAGYGITDAFTQAAADARYLGIAAQAADAAKLQGATWAAPPAIGATPNAINGTTYTASVKYLAPDGTTGAPAYSFASATTTGFRYAATGNIVYCGAGGDRAAFLQNGIQVASIGYFGWSVGSPTGVTDTALYRDSAGVVAQRNGANAQRMRIYGNFTDAANGDWLEFDLTTAGKAYISPKKIGTGAARLVAIDATVGLGYGLVITGQSTDGTSDAANGAAIILGHNVSGNRQFIIGDSETGIGFRVTGTTVDGYNSKTAARLTLGLGTSTSDVQIARNLIPTSVGGFVSRTKAGAFVDADFAAPVDGLIGIDTTNARIYVRVGGVWKSAALA